MFVFLDFEASSLAKDSYPIEVGWVFENGQSDTALIRPAPDWQDWDPRAEAVHQIQRQTLLRDGIPHDQVARRMVDLLSDHQLFASAPSWDGKWLSVLLRAAGLPRHSLKLRDTDLALRETAAKILAPILSDTALEAEIDAILQAANDADARVPRSHRALGDAQGEYRRWRFIQTAAETRLRAEGRSQGR